MSAVIAGFTVVAAASAYTAYEGYQTRKEAKRERERIRAKEAAQQAELEEAAKEDKRKANEKMLRRLGARGHTGTVVGGRTTTKPTLLGDV